jgi:hypothetical protein
MVDGCTNVGHAVMVVCCSTTRGDPMHFTRLVTISLAARFIIAAGPCPIIIPALAQQPTSETPATLVGPICPSQNTITVNTTVEATLSLQINGKDQEKRSAAPGEVSLDVPDPTHLSQGDVVQVSQLVGNSSTLSNPIVVRCTDVLTYHNDSQRTGWNPTENTLTAANVNSVSFGLVAQVGPDVLDEQIDAQPLVVTKQNVQGFGIRNVVYVVTAANTVYALDAWSGKKLLSTNLGAAVPTPLGCNNNSATVGTTSTPTIDRQAQTLYLMSYTLEAGQPTYKLHALDLSSLNEKPGSPQIVSATQKLSDQSDFKFNATYQRQRAALLQANGNIYAGFAAFCDFKATNSRGWVLGWNAATLAGLASNELTNRRTDATTADCWPGNNQPCFLSSVWMSGYGLAADRDGNIFFATGNTGPGTTDHTLNVAESVVKVSNSLSVLDVFTPNNAKLLDINDKDFGSGGVMVVPDLSSGPLQHIAVAAGKDGRLFILDRDNLGGFHTPDVPRNVQIDFCSCGPSYFEGADGQPRIVTSGGNTLRTWKVNTSQSPALAVEGAGTINPTAQEGGFFTSISSNGKQSGTAIIWAVGRLAPNDTSKRLTLYAFDATAASNSLPLIWSSVAGYWNSSGNNYNGVPTVANGMVYVASYRQLSIFSRKRPQQPPVVASVKLESFAASAPPNPGNAYWGKVMKIDGSHLSLELRTGKVLDVDISPAAKAGTARIVTEGQSAKVSGTMNANGTFEADVLLRAEDPSLWGPDRAQ